MIGECWSCEDLGPGGSRDKTRVKLFRELKDARTCEFSIIGVILSLMLIFFASGSPIVCVFASPIVYRTEVGSFRFHDPTILSLLVSLLRFFQFDVVLIYAPTRSTITLKSYSWPSPFQHWCIGSLFIVVLNDSFILLRPYVITTVTDCLYCMPQPFVYLVHYWTLIPSVAPRIIRLISF